MPFNAACTLPEAHSMKAASLKEIKAELNMLENGQLSELILRLARTKKENKELLSYLLFEANDEDGYIASVKEEIAEQFKTVSKGHAYFVKKTLRKILRFVNKQAKYSGVVQTELELRIFFCAQIKENQISLYPGTVIYNLYEQQVKKINALVEKLPEDLQYDYHHEITKI